MLQPDALRAELELEPRREAHGTIFDILLTEEQALDLASGYVPTAVKAMVMAGLDWHDEDLRRAARPVPSRSTARGKKQSALAERPDRKKGR